jgi:hypothetical protein
MPTKEEQTIRSNALTLVNEAREALGRDALDELPRGVPRQKKFCPVACAIEGASVTDQVIRFPEEASARAVADAWGRFCHKNAALCSTDYEVFLPEALHTFVLFFDTGGLPQLIKEGHR